MGVTEKNLGSGVFLGSGSLSGGMGRSGSLSLQSSDGGEAATLLGDRQRHVAMETTGEEDGEEPKSGTSQEEEVTLRQVGGLFCEISLMSLMRKDLK